MLANGLKYSIFIYFLCQSLIGYNQLNIPNNHFYNRTVLSNSFLEEQDVKLKQHHSFKPFLDANSSISESPYSNNNQSNWFLRKLFQEHFFVFEGDDYWCAVDPILDLEFGIDNKLNQNYYWNTRGVRVQAKILNKVALSTTVYESQAIVPEYMSSFVKSHGEFRFSNNGYVQNNGVMPGYARSKVFGNNGFDFAYAEGHISYSPFKTLNIQFGNGNHFIGSGHRSLLLSDFSTNYPFLKPEISLFNGRLQYIMVYAAMQNLYRLPVSNTIESGFERKIGRFNYLEFNISKSFKIGLFEGRVYKRSDSLTVYPINIWEINPIIGLSGLSNENQNSIYGLNVSYEFNTNQIYGQVIPNGFQLGINALDLIIQNLDLSFEFNKVLRNTYLSVDDKLNYSHSNLPLAHPYVAGFFEGVIKVKYHINRFYLSNMSNYSKRDYHSDNIGVDILSPSVFDFQSNLNYNEVFYNQFECAYRFNNKNNLVFKIGHIFRKSSTFVNIPNTNIVYIGLVTDLKNKSRDW